MPVQPNSWWISKIDTTSLKLILASMLSIPLPKRSPALILLLPKSKLQLVLRLLSLALHKTAYLLEALQSNAVSLRKTQQRISSQIPVKLKSIDLLVGTVYVLMVEMALLEPSLPLITILCWLSAPVTGQHMKLPAGRCCVP